MEEPQARLDLDLRLQLPNSALFVGASQTGKTTLVLKLLQTPGLFNPSPKRILFYFDQYQDAYGDAKKALQKLGIEMLLYKGFPNITLESLDEI